MKCETFSGLFHLNLQMRAGHYMFEFSSSQHYHLHVYRKLAFQYQTFSLPCCFSVFKEDFLFALGEGNSNLQPFSHLLAAVV